MYAEFETLQAREKLKMLVNTKTEFSNEEMLYNTGCWRGGLLVWAWLGE